MVAREEPPAAGCAAGYLDDLRGGFGEARLLAGRPAEALRAADRAVAAAPNHAAVYVAAAKAALATGDAPGARRHAERSLEPGASGELADDARRVLADAGSGGRRR